MSTDIDRLDKFRQYLSKRGYEKPSDSDLAYVIEMIDLAYCRKCSRLGRAGLRRLSLEQLYQAADHFLRRNWGKRMDHDGFQDAAFKDNRFNPTCYIQELVGEGVLYRQQYQIRQKHWTAYKQLQEAIDGESQ